MTSQRSASSAYQFRLPSCSISADAGEALPCTCRCPPSCDTACGWRKQKPCIIILAKLPDMQQQTFEAGE